MPFQGLYTQKPPITGTKMGSTAYNAATMMVAAAAPKTTDTATVGADRERAHDFSPHALAVEQ
jgi:hypothetical protein